MNKQWLWPIGLGLSILTNIVIAFHNIINVWMVLFILSLLVNVALGFVLYKATWVATEKLDIAEQFVFNIKNQLQYILKTIQTIDNRGAFESDDEVGVTFNAIKATINTLNNFIEIEKPNEEI